MEFDDLVLEIYRFSEKVNEESIKRVSDLDRIRVFSIALSNACEDMIKYCDKEKKMEYTITSKEECKGENKCYGCIFYISSPITLDCYEIVKGLKVLGLPDCDNGIIYVKGEKK